MRDMELYALVNTLLAQECPKRGLAGMEYTQRYQPQQEGINDGPTIYTAKVADKRYGFRGVKQVPDPNEPQDLIRTETQSVETTLQFSVVQPKATGMSDLTHSDRLNIVASVMQTPDFVKLLIQNGASILRITDVRLARVINDFNEWEENPSFDAVIKHNDVWIDGVQEVKSFEFNLYRV
jgi:hypothetical protein